MNIQRIARLGGLLYLIIVALGLFEEVGVRSTIIVWDDPAATAANLQSMESLWRLGIASEYVLLICGLSLSVIFFILLRPVSKDLALLALAFNLVSIAIEAAVSLQLLAALFPLANGANDNAAVLASLAVKSHAQGFGVALIFFGCFCVIAGILIFRSGYLPKIIGVLMLLAGASYLINSFALILSPALASKLFPLILLPALVGEASLSLWLLFKGVTEEQFNAMSSRAHDRARGA